MVAKFYRPGRWSEAQILEEHAFAAELVAAEIPAVAPLVLQRRHAAPLRRLRLQREPAPRRPRAGAGRLRGAGMDRPLPGAHPHGGRGAAVRARPALDLQSFGIAPRDWLLEQREDAAGRAVATGKSAATRPCDDCGHRPGRPDGTAACASRGCTATATPATSCGRPTGPGARTSSTWTTRAPASRCRTSGCCCRASASSAQQQLGPPARRLRAVPRVRPRRTGADRAAAHAAADPLQRLAGAALGRPDLPDQLPLVRLQRLLEGADPDAAGPVRGDGGAAAGGVAING